MRFSMKWLLALTATFAVTCYGLIFPNPLIGNLFFTICVGLVVTGLICAVFQRGQTQAFWIGFVLVATSYLWLSEGSFGSGANSAIARTIRMQLGASVTEPELLTTTLLTFLYDNISSTSTISPFASPNAWQTYPAIPAQGPNRTMLTFRGADPAFSSFMAVGHAVFAVAIGWIGAAASRRLYAAQIRGRAIAGDVR